MNSITFVGDVHGHFQAFKKIVEETPGRIMQVGDMGIGFGKGDPNSFDTRVGFIRGNHDNPTECRQYLNYMGDFGYLESLRLFFVSGAWSIDQNLRVEGRDWWRDEELTMKQCGDALALYSKTKPEVVATHDAPTIIAQAILDRVLLRPTKMIPTRTGQLLDAMLAVHRPRVWVFGHHHQSHRAEIDGTMFVGLGELETWTMENAKVEATA